MINTLSLPQKNYEEDISLLFIIPYYEDKLIERCVRSISYHSPDIRYEILIIDDASDTPPGIYFNKSSQDKEIFVLTLESNSGPAAARNMGLRFAINNKFTYVSFIDSDDFLVTNFIRADFGSSDLTIYNSVETHASCNAFILSDLHIKKYNLCEEVNIEAVIIAYAKRPNRVPAITSCWGKVFKVSLLMDSGVRFNEELRTFEDVDFIVRYLLYAKVINFVEKVGYAHTNYSNSKGATFGKNSFRSLFGFLQMSRNFDRLVKAKGLTSLVDINHFRACYYSISLIRSAVHIKTIKGFLKFYQFVLRRINSPAVKLSFSHYDVKEADGRPLLKLLVLNRNSFLLTSYLFFVGIWRYKCVRRT